MSSSDYRKVTMMMDNPSYDGFLDGRDNRRPHHRMKPFVLVTLLLLAVVGVAVALAVILTGNKPNLEVPEAVTILGSLHISNRQYQDTYADRATKEFASLEGEVTDAMDRLYNKSIFRDIYVGSSVSGIRKGSVVVDFAIHLEIPRALFDLKKEENKKVSPPEYNEAYVHLVKAIDDNALGDFTIIEFSLSFDSESLSFDKITLPPVSRTVEQTAQWATTATKPKDACNDNPCGNGGTCVPRPDAHPYFACRCPEGSSGDLCQNGCIDIPIPQCCSFLPYNQTVSPNPFQLTETHEELMEFFELSYHFLTPTCHPDAQRVLCTVLNPQCPDRDAARAAGVGAGGDGVSTLLDFQLPCRSVCREVHDSCLSNLPSQLRREFEVFGNFCYSLPESKEESICFRSSQPGTAYDEPAGCKSSPCENGGACLELNGITRCRCPRGYGGQTCAYELPNPCSPSPCLNGGICKVSRDSLIPRFTCECRPPYQPPYCDSRH